MPYPHDPRLRGLAAAKFHSVRHPHEIDHPAVQDLESGELSPLPSWTIEKARLGITHDSVDVDRLPRLVRPRGPAP